MSSKMANINPAKRRKTGKSAESVFVYTGAGCSVPKDVVRVKFDPSVVEVADKAFEDCRQLREVVLNDELQKIGSAAFDNCKSLDSIRLPSAVAEICSGALYNCENLRELVLNDGLTKIGRSAFWLFKSLESITFPSKFFIARHHTAFYNY
jgi:hypothetical protein